MRCKKPFWLVLGKQRLPKVQDAYFLTYTHVPHWSA